MNPCDDLQESPREVNCSPDDVKNTLAWCYWGDSMFAGDETGMHPWVPMASAFDRLPGWLEPTLGLSRHKSPKHFPRMLNDMAAK